jgi:DNA (cytosine-5)-methyltransferase 1
MGHGVQISLAVDQDPHAVAVLQRNFPTAPALQADVADYFDGDLNGRITPKERETRRLVPEAPFLLVGGPPCQGNSDLNNRTRRVDPRNALYARMARAARVLEPSIVIIENVPTVVHDMNGVVEQTQGALEEDGYHVIQAHVELWRLGVPQTRKRHFLIASRGKDVLAGSFMNRLSEGIIEAPRTVRWAIEDLLTVTNRGVFDSPPKTRAENQERINWLFDTDSYDLPNHLRPSCHQSGKHSYKSVYGRLRWDTPAQTITTGFGSMGQGRFVHPERRRMITPHEAARLQGFPDYFNFSSVKHRTVLARLIGNAVPPLAMRRLVHLILAAPKADQYVMPGGKRDTNPTNLCSVE